MNLETTPLASPSPARKRTEFLSPTAPKWCSGCGYFAGLKELTQVFAQSGRPKEDFVIVSGIGCAGRLPYYTSTYGIHTLHGRAPAVALGLKVVRPELSTWVVTGDGDALSIGGNQTMHLLRRNPDIKVVLLNNRVYGLTKGQHSPTSPTGTRSATAPGGTPDAPLLPLVVALASGATFVARAKDRDPASMEKVFKAAMEHRGAAFVEVLMNCVTYNDGTFDSVTDRARATDTSFWLTDGEPLVFGAQGARRGIRLSGGRVETVSVPDGMDPRELGIHIHRERDPSPSAAFMLAAMEFPNEAYPFGVLRQVRAPVFEDEMRRLKTGPSAS